MASSFNSSTCQLKYSSFPPRQLNCSLSASHRQLKYSSSSSRQLNYSLSPCQLKDFLSSSRQLKYFLSPYCQLKDSSSSSLQLKDSSSSRQLKYQVFLSFRIETRRSFTSELLQALKATGMNVFFDEEKLEKGEEFLGQLTQAIKDSNLSIIILSADYASSVVCLRELSCIMALKRNQGHIVFPVFFQVDPSDVQNLRGSFKTSFDKHQSDEQLDQVKVKQWKADLAQVGTLKGIPIKGDRSEAEVVKHIVEYAIQKLKHKIFLSFAEDTRLNFTSHLLERLEDTGINVSDKAIEASDLSIVVLSKDYASSETCLAQLSGVMERKRTQKHIVIPIFYHVKPSDVQKNLGGSFKGKPQVQQWKVDLAEVCGLQGWPIEGSYFDRPDTEHIRDVVQYVIKKLNRLSRSGFDDLVGIDDQKEKILKVIEQEDSRIIGLWGMSGMGKTTLADAIYNEISSEFQSRCFLQNVREETEKRGMKYVRNELLSKLLADKIDIDTPSIGYIYRHRMESKKMLVVLDDVNDSSHIDFMGVKYFGDGSKIIITSRDKQVLKNGGVDKIHEVEMLNGNDSLQLFSTFAFKLLSPPPYFQDLSIKFLWYSQGNPLALKVLGSNLHKKSKKEWESEVDKLKECPEPKFAHIFKSSFDGLDEINKNIFLDITCFLKGNFREDVEEILNCLYKGALSGISNLLDRSLLYIDSLGQISMHDILEEIGKDIARQGSNDPGKYSRLWRSKDVNQVLRYNKGDKSIEGIKVNMSQMEDPMLLCRPGFENMFNLRYLHVERLKLSEDQKLLVDKVGGVSLPDQLRYLRWDNYPFKSLPPSFNPKNLVGLKLPFGQMKQLWNEDHQDLLNLRTIDLFCCEKLRKIPNLSGAISLESLICSGCKSLVELPRLNHLTSLKKLEFEGCSALKKFPEFPNISKLESLGILNIANCASLETLSNLPRYMWYLDADECTSLEKVSFTDHCLNSFLSLHDGGDDVPEGEKVSMLFRNCSSLNQDSIKNIVANAMLQIQSLAPRWARRKGIIREEFNRVSVCRNCLFYRFPGNEVPEDVFCYGSTNSWLHLKITPNRSSGRRFLAFAICLVADFGITYGGLKVTCKYQLKAADGEKLTSVCCIFHIPEAVYECDHVLVLFSENMIIMDSDYEEASFEFNIENLYPRGEIEVAECGVHVFYVDVESYSISDVMSCDTSNHNFDSATEMRPGDERRFGNDGEGDGGPKTWICHCP